MLDNSNGPSVVAPCKYCDEETVWLRTAYGGWHLFDVSMRLTDTSFAGNRFAVDRRSRLVIDLDCVLESRWPAQCLTLHKYSCPESYDDSRHYRNRPRQANEIDLTDLWRRLAASEAEQRTSSRSA
ncbi:hypothetical protein [Mycolicibacterium sp.]|uniref:hypothetical protein n=1 Tax=Mycolicibacterium sp. TaxID=2320850 RepID=UPI0037C76D70